MAEIILKEDEKHELKKLWYAVSTNETVDFLGTSQESGLKSSEVTDRLKKYGKNILQEEKEKSTVIRFLEQYKSYMQIVLVIAAFVSLYIQEYHTFLLLLILTVFNASLGYRQEAKAAASVAALNKMMKTVAKVRRDGEITQVEAEEIVPGDIVIVDAGDRVPADGRIILAENLQIEESALTGESTPVEKTSDIIEKPDLPLGDRINIAYMNTNVTRGHSEILVTDTGMNSEVGHIATMLQEEKAEKTPLTVQIDRVTLFIIGMAVLAFLSIVILGLTQGESFDNSLISVFRLQLAPFLMRYLLLSSVSSPWAPLQWQIKMQSSRVFLL